MDAQETVRLSIVIPCFNDGQFIREALASAEACLDPIYEIIIINDGSTDPFTCHVLSELQSKGYNVIEQVNQGLAAARNTGIKHAKGEYILPLDSDNRIRSAYIHKGIEILDRFADVAVVYGDVQCFGEASNIRQIPALNLTWLVNHNYIDACAVFRKAAWEECGPYDVNMPFGCYEDWDLWLSIAKKGYKFHHVPEILFDYRVRPISLSTAARSEEKSKVVCRYIAAKHAALFPKEFRYYYKSYRVLFKVLEVCRSIFKRRDFSP